MTLLGRRTPLARLVASRDSLPSRSEAAATAVGRLQPQDLRDGMRGEVEVEAASIMAPADGGPGRNG